MAEHSSGNHAHGMDEHTSTYKGFIKGSVALSIHLRLCAGGPVFLRFRPYAQCFYGLCGLIVGTIAVLIDVRTGGKWYLSVGVLVLFGLITAVNVS